MKRFQSYWLGLLLLAGLLLGCNSEGNSSQGDLAVTPTVPQINNHCQVGLLVTAVFNIDDLTSYTVNNYDYLERSEGAPRELYAEEITQVTLKDGQVADTDSAINIYFDEFHKADYIRVGGKTYVRHNEGGWEDIPLRDWEITVDGLMGDSPVFYDNLDKNVYWKNPQANDFSPGDPYCQRIEFDLDGASAWQFNFYNVPQGIFQSGVGGRRGGAGSYQLVQDRLQSGWAFQSADYSATIKDVFTTPQLVAESLRTKIGDGSESMYTTWETQWSNFNGPVTIRRPEQ